MDIDFDARGETSVEEAFRVRSEGEVINYQARMAAVEIRNEDLQPLRSGECDELAFQFRFSPGLLDGPQMRRQAPPTAVGIILEDERGGRCTTWRTASDPYEWYSISIKASPSTLIVMDRNFDMARLARARVVFVVPSDSIRPVRIGKLDIRELQIRKAVPDLAATSGQGPRGRPRQAREIVIKPKVRRAPDGEEAIDYGRKALVAVRRRLEQATSVKERQHLESLLSILTVSSLKVREVREKAHESIVKPERRRRERRPSGLAAQTGSRMSTKASRGQLGRRTFRGRGHAFKAINGIYYGLVFLLAIAGIIYLGARYDFLITAMALSVYPLLAAVRFILIGKNVYTALRRNGLSRKKALFTAIAESTRKIHPAFYDEKLPVTTRELIIVHEALFPRSHIKGMLAMMPFVSSVMMSKPEYADWHRYAWEAAPVDQRRILNFGRVLSANIRVLSQGRTKTERLEAATKIGQFGHIANKAISTLILALADEDKEISDRAMKALVEMGYLKSEEEEVVQVLIRALESDDFEIAKAGAEALGKVGFDAII
ncbi:MAG: HEAT repeat domain-containing protein, partial [Candidatus Omnitrophota bacterium]